MTMFKRMAVIGSCCLSFVLIRALPVYATVCPGDESTLLKDKDLLGVSHGVDSLHQLDRCLDYPNWTPWPRCSWEYEDASFNSRNDIVAAGNFFDWINCMEGPNISEETITRTVSISVELSGGSTTEISTELGWKTEEDITFTGTTQTTLHWEFSTEMSDSGSYSRKIAAGAVPGNTHYFKWDTVTYARRKGSRYVYYSGTVNEWCNDHSTWAASFADQTDYDSISATATTKYTIGQGVREDSCSPCNCAISWTGETQNVISNPPINYTSGVRFHDNGP